MDMSDDKLSSYSTSSSNRPSLNRSSGLFQDADPGSSQAVQKEHQTELTNFDDLTLDSPSPSSPYNGSIFSFCSFYFFLPKQVKPG